MAILLLDNYPEICYDVDTKGGNYVKKILAKTALICLAAFGVFLIIAVFMALLAGAGIFGAYWDWTL